MKPAWDKLMEDFADSPTSLVADVDCTTDGKPLCDKNGVQGFPSIKWGAPTDLKDYPGGRDYDSLKKFADENLGPQCAPASLSLCTGKDGEKAKAKYEKYMAMSKDRLDAKITKVLQDYEKELPLMQKTLAWHKAGAKKEEL